MTSFLLTCPEALVPNRNAVSISHISTQYQGPIWLIWINSIPGWIHIYLPWWRHQMETFSALLAICAGNSPASGEFPAQRPMMRSFDVFFDLCQRLRKQSWGWWFETLSRPLWCPCNDYKVWPMLLSGMLEHRKMLIHCGLNIYIYICGLHFKIHLAEWIL